MSSSIVRILIHNTFHEAHEFISVDFSISVTVDFLEECFNHWLVESSFKPNYWEGRFSQVYNLLPFEVARLIFVILNPEIVNNRHPLFIRRPNIGALCICDLSSSRLIIFVGSVAANLVSTSMLIHIIFGVLILFFLNRFYWSLLLVVVVLLVMAWVVVLGIFVLFLHDLIHENRFVHTLCRVKTRCSLAVSLELVLAAHRDWTKKIRLLSTIQICLLLV